MARSGGVGDTALDLASPSRATGSDTQPSIHRTLPVTMPSCEPGAEVPGSTPCPNGSSSLHADEASVPPSSTTEPRVSSTQATLPMTTVPTTVPGTTGSTVTPPTPQPTTPGTPLDCGASTPSGWPTTTAFLPSRGRCLIDAFTTGAGATFRVVIAEPDYPAHKVTYLYEVVGVQRVKVTTDRTQALNPPNTTTTAVCSALTYIGSPGIYQVSQCVPA